MNENIINYSDIITFISLLVAILSLLFAFYSHYLSIVLSRQNKDLIKEKTRYSWEDVHSGVQGLIRWVDDKDIREEILVTVSGSGAIIANLYMNFRGTKQKLYTIILENPENPWQVPPQDHTSFTTDKFQMHVPIGLLSENCDQKVLIVDSSFFSGNTVRKILDVLQDRNFKHIKFICLARSKPSANLRFKPDYVYFKSGVQAFDYPWGPA